MATRHSFDIDITSDRETGETLLIGLSHVGMAGLTAADYVVRHLDSQPIGHVAPSDLPAIAPFEDGTPRHHSRLYNVAGADLTVLVSELFVPVWAARSFVDALLEWANEQAIEEIAVFHGVPFPHGPDEHAVFYVATAPYREARLGGTGLQPLRGGFLDGVVGELVTRGLDDDSSVGVFATPTHPPGPDIEATLRLLDAVQDIYGFSVDEAELERLGEQLKRYYEQLVDRMQTLGEGETPVGSRDYPEDRMYM